MLAGYARFPSRADSVNRTGLDGRPVPVEQEASAGPALLLVAEQLAEPFRARALWRDARISDADRAIARTEVIDVRLVGGDPGA